VKRGASEGREGLQSERRGFREKGGASEGRESLRGEHGFRV